MIENILGDFWKLGKETIIFFTSYQHSVCPSVRLHRTSQLPLHAFSRNLMSDYFFFLNLWENSSFIKIGQGKTGALFEDLSTFMTISRWTVLRMKKVSTIQRKSEHILGSIIFFRKLCREWECTKYGRNRKATDDNLTRSMPFACWIAKATDTHSQNINTYSFSTATMVMLTRLMYVSTYITSLGTFYIWRRTASLANSGRTTQRNFGVQFRGLFMYVPLILCVVFISTSNAQYTHTHTHTHIYIYIKF